MCIYGYCSEERPEDTDLGFLEKYHVRDCHFSHT